MIRPTALILLALATSACAETPEVASGSDAPVAPAALADLSRDLETVEQKIVALAEALNEDQYAWRPMDGVRSAGEVFMHVAADNYFLPLVTGVPVPEHTGITMDYETVVAFEQGVGDRDQILTELRDSFAHLRDAIAEAVEADPGRVIEFFGRTSTLQGVWIDTAVHLHEHLGQSIAYARANEVVPPWSQAN